MFKRTIITPALPGLILIAVLLPFQADARSKKIKPLEVISSMANEALVKPPVADETCFSPEELCDVKLYKFIMTAEKSIDVAIFDLNLDKLVHELLVKSKKIPVRIVVDRRQAKAGHSLVPLLIKAGASVRIGRQRGIMHNKFVIVDGKMIETGSFNYTNGAAFKNNENQVYLATPTIVEKFKNRFEKVWNAATPAAANSP